MTLKTQLGEVGMDISLEGKVALVTGTGPNIGSGLALMLAKYGREGRVQRRARREGRGVRRRASSAMAARRWLSPAT